MYVLDLNKGKQHCFKNILKGEATCKCAVCSCFTDQWS